MSLINQPEFIEAACQCQKKIDRCRIFLNLVNTGKSKFKQELFQQALDNFIEAEKLFVTTELQLEIEKCKIQIKSIQNKANEIYLKAKTFEQESQQNPYNIKQLNKALILYDQCYQLINQPKFLEAASHCQRKIDSCNEFLNLVNRGKSKFKQELFQQALDNFIEAEKLFVTTELQLEIEKCEIKIKKIEQYEKFLEQSKQKAKQGKFQEAITLIKTALNTFSREDGQQLIAKLDKVIRAKELYNLGLIAEQTGDLDRAKLNYVKAIHFLPELTECKVRLSIILVKKNPKEAIFYLEGIEGEKADYIRGFAHFQLGNWQQTNREWKYIRNDAINSQREIISKFTKRDRAIKIKEIETAVDNSNLEIAKKLSLDFINKLGSEPTIEKNLDNHIQPLLDRQIWDKQDWQKIAAKTEQIWLKEQDINSLHNWAMATYYQTQINSNKLADFIITWSTALANIDSNPVLQNIPWLGSSSINIKDTATKLKQILENAIDAVKDDDINKYLKHRDIYRREMVTLSLIQQNNCGVRIKQQLFILPGCYQRFRSRIPKMKFPPSVWGALYTDWGLAVAACLEGDVTRAIKIKPYQNPSSEADNFAHCFVSYHEGCYYLQNLEWRKAKKSLQQAKSEIKSKSDWCKEIDKLCEIQRQKIDSFDEHLQFSEFWYELVESQASRSYFAEFKARKIAEKLSEETISNRQGLNELREIQNIDKNNPVVLELIKVVETIQESQKIDNLLEQGKFEEAIRVAKLSSDENIRFKVAELCLEIIFKQLQSDDVSYEAIQALNLFAQWAYELCPYEPTFVPVYRQLREIGIHC